MRPVDQPPIYTGDLINPKAVLREPSGRHMDADVTVEIESPLNGTGNILTTEKLGGPGQVSGDQVDSRTNKLMALEAVKGAPLIPVTTRTVKLYDDGEHDDGAIEPDGIFGNPLPDLTRFEGHYKFHARAVYGENCRAAREAHWSVYVSVGIDPVNTMVTASSVRRCARRTAAHDRNFYPAR